MFRRILSAIANVFRRRPIRHEEYVAAQRSIVNGPIVRTQYQTTRSRFTGLS